MSKFSKLLKEKEKNIQIEDTFNNIEGIEEVVKLISFDEIEPNSNPYPLSDIEDMVESIKMFGLEQNLVVQKKPTGKYLLITGHRRYYAIKSILESDEAESHNHLDSLYCKIVSPDTDELTLRFRLHETNISARPLLSMNDEERKKVVSEYMDLIAEARERKLTINGIAIAGKTRDLIAKHFAISSRTAQTIISDVKNEDEDQDSPKKEVNEVTPEVKQSQDLDKKIIALSKSFEKATDLSSDELSDYISKVETILNQFR